MLPAFSPEQITGAVSVLERLIGLLKTRDENHQHLINDIVAPYFIELQVAYTSYLTTLRATKDMVEDGQSYPVIYKKLKPLRAADLIVRDKVREMADAYRDGLSAHPEIAEFFGEACSLFGYWNGYHHSGTLRILTALEEGSEVYNHEFLVESLEMTIDAGEEQWRKLASQYAGIQLKYLQPVKVAPPRNKHTTYNHSRLSRLWASIQGFLS